MEISSLLEYICIMFDKMYFYELDEELNFILEKLNKYINIVNIEVWFSYMSSIDKHQKAIRDETCNARSQLPNIQCELIG